LPAIAVLPAKWQKTCRIYLPAKFFGIKRQTAICRLPFQILRQLPFAASGVFKICGNCRLPFQEFSKFAAIAVCRFRRFQNLQQLPFAVSGVFKICRQLPFAVLYFAGKTANKLLLLRKKLIHN